MDVVIMPAKKIGYSIYMLKYDCEKEGKSNLGMIVTKLSLLYSGPKI